jgi:hypothetical protein
VDRAKPRRAALAWGRGGGGSEFSFVSFVPGASESVSFNVAAPRMANLLPCAQLAPRLRRTYPYTHTHTQHTHVLFSSRVGGKIFQPSSVKSHVLRFEVSNEMK